MKREQFTAIRKKFFPADPGGFLAELGYTGNPANLRTKARAYEAGREPIPKNVARFAWLLDLWSVQGAALDPENNQPDDLPEWPEDL